jgi:hypothetical protein
MSNARRRLVACLLTLALTDGLVLPFQAGSGMPDADGACGPALVLARTGHALDVPPPPHRSGHCVLCHFWGTLATGRIAPEVRLLPPPPAAGPGHPAGPADVDPFARTNFAPRSPPARA